MSLGTLRNDNHPGLRTWNGSEQRILGLIFIINTHDFLDLIYRCSCLFGCQREAIPKVILLEGVYIREKPCKEVWFQLYRQDGGKELSLIFCWWNISFSCTLHIGTLLQKMNEVSFYCSICTVTHEYASISLFVTNFTISQTNYIFRGGTRIWSNQKGLDNWGLLDLFQKH